MQDCQKGKDFANRNLSYSMLSLQYITDISHRFKAYAENRLAEILEYTDVKSWQHVDGKQNQGKYDKSRLHGREFLIKENATMEKVSVGRTNENNLITSLIG